MGMSLLNGCPQGQSAPLLRTNSVQRAKNGRAITLGYYGESLVGAGLWQWLVVIPNRYSESALSFERNLLRIESPRKYCRRGLKFTPQKI